MVRLNQMMVTEVLVKLLLQFTPSPADFLTLQVQQNVMFTSFWATTLTAHHLK